MSVELHPQRERDLRYCLTVLLPEIEKDLAEMRVAIFPLWRFRRYRVAKRRVDAGQARWQRILNGEEHAPDE